MGIVSANTVLTESIHLDRERFCEFTKKRTGRASENSMGKTELPRNLELTISMGFTASPLTRCMRPVLPPTVTYCVGYPLNSGLLLQSSGFWAHCIDRGLRRGASLCNTEVMRLMMANTRTLSPRL
jgi:hypothetical protein